MATNHEGAWRDITSLNFILTILVSSKKYIDGNKKLNDELMIAQENNDFIAYLKDERFKF